MAITLNQYNNNFVTRDAQIQLLKVKMDEVLNDWGRVMTTAHPDSESGLELTLAGYAARLKTPFNNRRQALIDLATAIEAIA